MTSRPESRYGISTICLSSLLQSFRPTLLTNCDRLRNADATYRNILSCSAASHTINPIASYVSRMMTRTGRPLQRTGNTCTRHQTSVR
ncbi:hypothetical protein TNIN_65221 [Trichonephila inaurata madagascariensis]|uniref:Uncharacterized protein n=1 Tax=Trichonephila inaurata madagascariensis TaxID=2747483 RepID=A0A8X7C267_9ARAC|nr:hypothetical protein TNIN_65221 [Trichonephila inaurata madagascariensis]